MISPLRFRVLFLASWYPSRVARILGVFVRRKAEAMTALCDVAVLHVAEDPQLSSPYDHECSTQNGVYTVVVYFRPGRLPLLRGIVYNIRYFQSYYMGWKIIKKDWGYPTLAHVNVIDRAGYFALFLKKIAGLGYVITEHSTPDIDFVKGVTQSTHIPLRMLRQIVIRNSGMMNVDSQASLRYLEMCGFEGKFRVIPNVVEIDERLAVAPKEQLRSGKKICVHISILIARKNVADIIRAVAAIYHTQRRKEIEFHIVGEDGQEAQLRALASTLDVFDKAVFFRGFLSEEEKGRLLASADFHILNSNEEGFSVVTAEAISYGIPVIATACGGPEDFVTPETGILIERNNLSQLEKAILHMLDHSGEYDRTALQEFGRAHFSPTSVAEQTYDLYRTALTSWKCGNTGTFARILPEWRVLDIGSGHQPHPRANVLLDKYTGETEHRTSPIVLKFTDKSFVTGDALEMPFADKSFDFAIASHIAEHVDDPSLLCAEMSRVAKNGYLETPGPLTECLLPVPYHRWIVSMKDGVLVFREKEYIPPPSQLFFRFFYLNRDGYSDRTMFSENPLMLFLNWAILSLWKYVPGAYTIIKWSGSVHCVVHRLTSKSQEHPA
jgi:glycosyltransferase involved in cell wall biosynthesis